MKHKDEDDPVAMYDICEHCGEAYSVKYGCECQDAPQDAEVQNRSSPNCESDENVTPTASRRSCAGCPTSARPRLDRMPAGNIIGSVSVANRNLRTARERAGNRCELCPAVAGKPHWKTETPVILYRCRIGDHAHDQLVVCQRCRLRLERGRNVQRASETREIKSIGGIQQNLFGGKNDR